MSVITFHSHKSPSRNHHHLFLFCGLIVPKYFYIKNNQKKYFFSYFFYYCSVPVNVFYKKKLEIDVFFIF